MNLAERKTIVTCIIVAAAVVVVVACFLSRRKDPPATEPAANRQPVQTVPGEADQALDGLGISLPGTPGPHAVVPPGMVGDRPPVGRQSTPAAAGQVVPPAHARARPALDDAIPPGMPHVALPDAPPDMDKPDAPLTLTAQIHSFVRKSLQESGPEAAELGKQLLSADIPHLRVAGVAMLSEFGALDTDILQQIAMDEDPAVPLNALGWFRDTGVTSDADAFASVLVKRALDGRTLVDLVNSGRLTGAGSRIALDLANDRLETDDARELYSSISTNAAQDYSVRMKSVLMLRDTMDFASYRAKVNAMISDDVSEEDELWQEGIMRLAARLEGPIEVHTGPAALTVSDIDQMLAREYPTMLEDLAELLDDVMGDDEAYVAPGCGPRLNEYLNEFAKRPWTEEQQPVLVRLGQAAEQLPSLENDGPLPANVPQPPPGTDVGDDE